MLSSQRDGLKRGTTRLSSALMGESFYKRVVIKFAKRHNFIYFKTVHSGNKKETPVILGSTAALDQVDAHHCIGTHADYDVTFVQRLASVGFKDYKTTLHRWYIVQIDLNLARNVPYIFVGTRQQTKAYYARLLSSHRECSYLTFDSEASKNALFHSQYIILASPAQMPTVQHLFNNEMVDTMASHQCPFAIEIEGDSLTVITEAQTPSEQLLDKLLHYGLWVAKQVDHRLS